MDLTRHRSLLHLWLVLVLLTQSASATGGWHVDVPSGGAGETSAECPIALTCSVDEGEHHHSCQPGQGSAALTARSQSDFPLTAPRHHRAVRFDTYTDPLAELPLRPPNA